MSTSGYVRVAWWTAVALALFSTSLVGLTALEGIQGAGWLNYGPIRSALAATAYYIFALGLARQLPESPGRQFIMLVMSGLLFVITGYLLYGIMSMFDGGDPGGPISPGSAIDTMLEGVAAAAKYAFIGFAVLAGLFVFVRLSRFSYVWLATDSDPYHQDGEAPQPDMPATRVVRGPVKPQRYSRPLLTVGVAIAGTGYLFSAFGPINPGSSSVERMGLLLLVGGVAIAVAAGLKGLRHREGVLAANIFVTSGALLATYGLLFAVGDASPDSTQAADELEARVTAVRVSLKSATALVLVAIGVIGVLWSAIAFFGNRSAPRRQRRIAYRVRRVSEHATLLIVIGAVTHVLLRPSGVIEALTLESLSHIYLATLFAEAGLVIGSAAPRLLKSDSASIGAASLRGAAVMQLAIVFVATIPQTGEFLMGVEYLHTLFPADAEVYTVVRRASWWLLAIPAIVIGRTLLHTSGLLAGRIDAVLVVRAIMSIFAGVMVWNAGVELADLGIGYRILAAVVLGASIGYSASQMLALLPPSSENSVLTGLRGIASSAFRSANIGGAVALYLVFARPSVQTNFQYLPLFEWLMLTVLAMFVARRTWTGFAQAPLAIDTISMTLPPGWRRHRQRVGRLSGEEPHATRLIRSQENYLDRGDAFDIATRWSIGMAEIGAEPDVIAEGLRQIHVDADSLATGVSRSAYWPKPDKKTSLARQVAMERMAMISTDGDARQGGSSTRPTTSPAHVSATADDFVHQADPVHLIAVTVTTMWNEGVHRNEVSGAVHQLLRYHPAHIPWYVRWIFRSRAERQAVAERKSLADSVVTRIQATSGS